MAKIRISAKAVLRDIQRGAKDSDLMTTYGLSPEALRNLFKKLIEAGHLDQSDLDRRYSRSAEPDASEYPVDRTPSETSKGDSGPGSPDSSHGTRVTGSTTEPAHLHSDRSSEEESATTLSSLISTAAGVTFLACMIGWLVTRVFLQVHLGFAAGFLAAGLFSLAILAGISYRFKVPPGYIALVGAGLFVVNVATVDWSEGTGAPKRDVRKTVATKMQKRPSRNVRPPQRSPVSTRGANNEALVEASFHGDAPKVKHLLKQGANVDSRDRSGQAGLVHAARQGHLQVVKVLLANKADVHATDRHGVTSLTMASAMGHGDIVRLLLSKGADVNAKDKSGSTALMQASAQDKREVARILLEHGADVNVEDRHKMTALRWARTPEMKRLLVKHGGVEPYNEPTRLNKRLISACRNGAIERVKNLLAKGADINGKDNKGKTPLMGACFWRKEEAVKFLLENGADVNIQDNEGMTALLWVCHRKRPEIVKLLLDAGADANHESTEGRTPLAQAAATGDVDTVKLLLDRGADANKANRSGNTALMEATDRGPLSLVEILIKAGADVNSRNKRGRTALMEAARSGNSEIVQVLVDNGAAVTVQDTYGQTPLIWALSAKQPNPWIIHILLEKGAPFDVVAKGGKTPLMLARKSGDKEIIEILEKFGAVAGKDEPEDPAASESARTGGRFKPAHSQKRLREALIAACRENRETEVKRLLDQGADPNARTKTGMTALMIASAAGYAESVELLLDKAADVNAMDRQGMTALMFAAREGRPNVVELLMEQRAYVNAKNSRGKTALRIANEEMARRKIGKGPATELAYHQVIMALKRRGGKM